MMGETRFVFVAPMVYEHVRFCCHGHACDTIMDKCADHRRVKASKQVVTHLPTASVHSSTTSILCLSSFSSARSSCCRPPSYLRPPICPFHLPESLLLPSLLCPPSCSTYLSRSRFPSLSSFSCAPSRRVRRRDSPSRNTITAHSKTFQQIVDGMKKKPQHRHPKLVENSIALPCNRQVLHRLAKPQIFEFLLNVDHHQVVPFFFFVFLPNRFCVFFSISTVFVFKLLSSIHMPIHSHIHIHVQNHIYTNPFSDTHLTNGKYR